MKVADVVAHISPSSLATGCKCLMMWHFAYVQQIKMPPGVAMLRGSGAHEARKMNLRQKIATGVDLPLQPLTDAARDLIHNTFAQGEVDLFGVGVPRERAEAETIDAAVSASACDYAAFQSRIQPMYVEAEYRASSPICPVPLMGYVDCYDVDQVISDLKVTGRAVGQDSADRNIQLTFYDVLARANTLRPKALCIHNVVCGRKGQSSPETFRTRRTGQQREALLARVEALVRAVEAETWLPCSPDAWWCCEDYCGYARGLCPYFRRGKRRPKT